MSSKSENSPDSNDLPVISSSETGQEVQPENVDHNTKTTHPQTIDPESPRNEEIVHKVYTKRWLVLTTVVVLNISNAAVSNFPTIIFLWIKKLEL